MFHIHVGDSLAQTSVMDHFLYVQFLHWRTCHQQTEVFI